MVRSAISRPSFCPMYKYGPRTGYTDANDEYLFFIEINLSLTSMEVDNNVCLLSFHSLFIF